MGYAIREDGQGYRAVNGPDDVGNNEIYSDAPPARNLAEGQTKVLKSQAQATLDRSDITVLRCYENAVTVPTMWRKYRLELRAIISGTSTSTTLPTRPDYPAGT